MPSSRPPLRTVLRPEGILAMRTLVDQVHVDGEVGDYIVRLVGATRDHQELALGGSPRASLALFKAAQALAAVQGRDHVLPDDIKALVMPVLEHRLIVRPEAALRGRSSQSILQDILRNTPLDLGTVTG